MKIYLGGKISPEDWRHAIIPALKVITENPEATIQFDQDATLHNAIFGNHDYIGPFYLTKESAEDHHVNIPDLCLYRVSQCDIFFCWFDPGDELSAYGTMIEIGAAYSMGKKIVVAYDIRRAAFSDHTWFARKCADIIISNETDPVGALAITLNHYKRTIL